MHLRACVNRKLNQKWSSWTWTKYSVTECSHPWWWLSCYTKYPPECIKPTPTAYLLPAQSHNTTTKKIHNLLIVNLYIPKLQFSQYRDIVGGKNCSTFCIEVYLVILWTQWLKREIVWLPNLLVEGYSEPDRDEGVIQERDLLISVLFKSAN